MLTGLPVATPLDHAVIFYDHDAEIVSAVAAYARDGLQSGDAVVLLTTAAHGAAIRATLEQHGVDVRACVDAGTLDLRDAHTTLAEFRSTGAIDYEGFAAHMVCVIEAATGRGEKLRIFGEVVTLLWEEGDIAGAIHLETVWNDVIDGAGTGLLCSYPTGLLASAGLAELRTTCALHSEVIAPSDYGSPRPLPEDPGELVADLSTAQRTEVFVPTSEAVMAARRFVDATLEHWHLQQFSPDAMLLVSEMATNAVVHAGSPFRVFLHHSPGVLHLSVRDAQRGWFEQGNPTEAEVNGRGVHIVEALAERWGCDAVADGKVVWAELTVEG